ncbi:uncharacterized protein [Procambarus clarkii]|uniref:uncharacterized protein n=1 Tax=Procambarus clarkii TaxID=6728 RepID=UPI003743B4E0
MGAPWTLIYVIAPLRSDIDTDLVSFGSCKVWSSSTERSGQRDMLSSATGAVEAVLLAVTQTKCSVILFTDGISSTTDVYLFGQMVAPWGLSVFTVSTDGQDANGTLTPLSQVVSKAQQVRQASWCVTVVVVSDDVACLAAVAQWSLKSGLLVWSTRLLVATRLPLHHLHVLHNTFSITNSMLLITDDLSHPNKVTLYIHLPYWSHGAQALKIGFWTPHRGLALTTSLPLFPDKFANPILVASPDITKPFILHIDASGTGIGVT